MARNPEYTNSVESVDIDSIDIESVPEFDMEDMDFANPKEMKKFITRIERICRTSFEYKQFIAFLRDNAGFNTCSVMENVSNEDNRSVKIHIHHHPLTLYDIVVAICNKHVALHESMAEDLIAKEVMYNHYKLHVGLIPVSETVHELIHSQYLFIPNWAVFGKWREFVEEYKEYIPEDTLSNIEKSEELSKEYDHDENMKILESGMLITKVHDDSFTPSEERIFEKIKNTLNELKNKKE